MTYSASATRAPQSPRQWVLARGDQLNGEKHRRTIAMIGDASIVNGVAMEGLNNAGTLKRQFLVVLNDNGMSIAKPQGALAGYFDRIRVSPHYEDFKKRALGVLKRLPAGGRSKRPTIAWVR